MVNPASINTSKARSIPMKSRTLLTAATLIAPLAFLGQGGVEASVDAVSAASMTLKVVSITQTTATVQYSQDSYDYGYRTLCYDPSPAAAKNNCKITATDPDDDEDPYSASGSFTTLTPPTALELPPSGMTTRDASQAVYDVRGRKVDGYRGAPRDFIFRRNSAR